MAGIAVTGPCFVFCGVGPAGSVVGGDMPAVTQPGGSRASAFNPTTGTMDLTYTSVRLTIQGASNKTPAFLGIAEVTPKIHLRPMVRQWRASETGEVANEAIWMGEDGLIFADVNLYSETIYRRLAARPFSFANRGQTSDVTVGTLLSREQVSYPLWLYFPYSTKASFGAAPPVLPGVTAFASGPSGEIMPQGYHFLDAYCMGPDVLDPLSTRARKISLAFHAIPQRVIQGGRTRPLCYDHDMSALAGVPEPTLFGNSAGGSTHGYIPPNYTPPPNPPMNPTPPPTVPPSYNGSLPILTG
jgi:hypothetical protein